MNAVPSRFRSQASWSPTILRGRLPPGLPGAQLPVARRRCDHFTTLEGATLSASATFRTVCPSSSRAIARSRKSIEIARLIDKASIVVFINLNQIKTENGIPKRFTKKTKAYPFDSS